MASFAYYGSVLSSSELLEKNLLCVINADEEHQVKHRHEGRLCYCIPFGNSDYQTLLISSLGEVACELMTQDINVFITIWGSYFFSTKLTSNVPLQKPKTEMHILC